MENAVCSRREFIVKVGSGAAALAALAPVIGAGSAYARKKNPVDGAPITLNLTREDYKALAVPGGALKITNTLEKGKPIIVIRTSETEVTALSSKCTHWGCELPLPADGVIICPCHDASFSSNGKVLKGPAKKDLVRYRAVLEGSVITIRKRPSAPAKGS